MNQHQKRILLASFLSPSSPELAEEYIHNLVEKVDLSSPYIFLFRRSESPTDFVVTYNVSDPKVSRSSAQAYTMRVHRKKQTNTLYTINALNAAVAIQHSGSTGKNLPVNWSAYENCLLLTEGKNLQVHPVEVVKIYKIEEPPEEN